MPEVKENLVKNDDSPDFEDSLSSLVENAIDDSQDNEIEKIFENIDKLNRDIKMQTHTEEIKPQPVRTKKRQPKYIVGTFTVILALLTMGVAIIISLFTPAGIVTAAKISPIILVYLGIEIAANVVIHKNINFRVNVRGMIICLSLIVFTFLISLVTLLSTEVQTDRLLIEKRLSNELKNELVEEFKNNPDIKSIEVELFLLQNDETRYNTTNDILSTDTINITVYFNDVPTNITWFADKCRRTLDKLDATEYDFNKIIFISQNSFNKLSVIIDAKFQSNISSNEIAKNTSYFSNDVIIDLPDVEDVIAPADFEE